MNQLSVSVAANKGIRIQDNSAEGVLSLCIRVGGRETNLFLSEEIEDIFPLDICT